MSELTTLSKLFDKRIYRIPDYQRGYAWTLSQCEDFWDDLTNLTNDRSHYTGMLSLKLLGVDEYKDWQEEQWIIKDKDYEAYHVVDGQQRLTTFIILMSAVLDLTKEKEILVLNGDDIEDIKSRYIVEYKKPLKIEKAYKFGYEHDNPSSKYLRSKILGEQKNIDLEETFYTLNLENAKDFFKSKVEELYDVKGKVGIEELFKKLINRLKFNVHYIDATKIADEKGLKGCAIIILVGKMFKEVGFCTQEALDKGIQKVIPAKKAAMLGLNQEALKIGMES